MASLTAAGGIPRGNAQGGLTAVAQATAATTVKPTEAEANTPTMPAVAAGPEEGAGIDQMDFSVFNHPVYLCVSFYFLIFCLLSAFLFKNRYRIKKNWYQHNHPNVPRNLVISYCSRNEKYFLLQLCN